MQQPSKRTQTEPCFPPSPPWDMWRHQQQARMSMTTTVNRRSMGRCRLVSAATRGRREVPWERSSSNSSSSSCPLTAGGDVPAAGLFCCARIWRGICGISTSLPTSRDRWGGFTVEVVLLRKNLARHLRDQHHSAPAPTSVGIFMWILGDSPLKDNEIVSWDANIWMS
jgi:hypothetical protein